MMFASGKLLSVFLLISGAFCAGIDSGFNNDQTRRIQWENREDLAFDNLPGTSQQSEIKKKENNNNDLTGTDLWETEKENAEFDPTGIRDNLDGNTEDEPTGSDLWKINEELTEDEAQGEGLQGEWQEVGTGTRGAAVRGTGTRGTAVRGTSTRGAAVRGTGTKRTDPRRDHVLMGRRGTVQSQHHVRRTPNENPPTGRACSNCDPSVSVGCSNGGICCTDSGSCDSTGANCPANRQKTTQLAQNAAMWAKAASDAQNGAGLQAAHQVKAQLAEKACQASNSAQAALAGKQSIVEAFQQQICDAQAVMQEQTASLCNLRNTAEMAAQLYCDAQMQMKILTGAYQNAQCYAQQTAALAQAMQSIKEEKDVLIACAQGQIEELYGQLGAARDELATTCCAAQSAARSAAEARANAMRCRKREVPEGAESQDALKNGDDPTKTALLGTHHRHRKVASYAPQPPPLLNPGPPLPVARADGGRCCGEPPCGGPPCGGPPCGGPPCCGPVCCGGVCGGSQCETACCEVVGANSPANRQKSTASAQCAAQEAEAASGAQQAAGAQASHQVRSQLAEKACQASNSAQVALAGKQATVDQLQEQIRDAEAVLQEEASNLQIVVGTVEMANREACVAVQQLETIGGALHVAQQSVATMAEISRNVDLMRDQKVMLLEDAKRQIEQLLCELNEARQDLDATCQAAQAAAAAALQAQQNVNRNKRMVEVLRRRRNGSVKLKGS